MLREFFRAKIHRATITEAELYYEGSITIDTNLLEASGIGYYEKVQVVNLNNGTRLETYTIPGDAGSGIICLNGPAARLGMPGDEVVIIAYAFLTETEVPGFTPRVVKVDKQNKITSVQ